MTTVTVLTTDTRPDTDVGFFEATPEERQYRRAFYIEARKILSFKVEFSSDHLSKTTTLVFASPDDKELYLADPAIKSFRQRRAAYNAANLIESATSEE